MNNVEEIVIHKFRQLSVEKQEDVLQFLDLIQQNLIKKPSDTEIKTAKEILNSAKKRALANSQKSASELWKEFNHTKNDIAQEYETKKDY